MKKIPLYLTLSRVVLAPLIGVVFIWNQEWAWIFAGVTFIALSITDYFDGMLARRWNVVSDFGKYFDPAGDKALVLVALVALLKLKMLDPYVVILFLLRDVVMGSLRSYSASQGLVLAARSLGKLKTAFQMTAIPLMFFPDFLFFYGFGSFALGYWMLWGACILSLVSLGDYMIQVARIRPSSAQRPAS